MHVRWCVSVLNTKSSTQSVPCRVLSFYYPAVSLSSLIVYNLFKIRIKLYVDAVFK